MTYHINSFTVFDQEQNISSEAKGSIYILKTVTS